MLITKTPLRISLLGGGTDMPAFYKQHMGCVVSFAINKFMYISVNRKFDGTYRISYSKTENVNTINEIEHDIVRECLKAYGIQIGLEITSVSDIPGNGTGLGSSSAFTVGLINALARNHAPKTCAERAFLIEGQKCGHPVGKQDQYAAAFGGMNFMQFHRSGDVTVEPIVQLETWTTNFQNHCLLLWTGRTRDANEILTEQQKGFHNGANVQMGIQLATLARDFHLELTGGADMKRIGEFISEGWRIKKFFAPGVTNPVIDDHYNGMRGAMNYGAYGGKLLGAGGGGFMFFIAPPDTHQKIVDVTGLPKLEIKIEPKGSEVIYES